MGHGRTVFQGFDNPSFLMLLDPQEEGNVLPVGAERSVGMWRVKVTSMSTHVMVRKGNESERGGALAVTVTGMDTATRSSNKVNK